ncbi:hypothetical protein PR048_021189 [Dryococelus australis]|uniref:Uncharacterized protein n=1 Tax=Dryococelus australis TaxID=614101 RepID=A0ABQ9GXK0_9NEOP|nr:hypothetical protein PR048_021189 [Dryococelus australis]
MFLFSDGAFRMEMHVMRPFAKRKPRQTPNIVQATCILLNFVGMRGGFKYEESLTCEMEDIPIYGTGGMAKLANIRDIFCCLFSVSDRLCSVGV